MTWWDHWEARVITVAMMFVGILLLGGDFVAAFILSAASLSLTTLNFIWQAISHISTLTFMAGLARLFGWL